MKIEEVPELTLPIIKPNRDYFCQYCDKVKGNRPQEDLCGSSSQGWLVCVYKLTLGFPHGSTVESACRRSWVRSLGWEEPWRRKWQPTPVFLPGESHGQRSLEGYSLWGCTESDTTERLSTHTHKYIPGSRSFS